MNGHIETLTDKDFRDIELCLEFWFSQKLTRNSILPFKSIHIDPRHAVMAARLFKRGARGVFDQDTGVQTPIPAPTINASPLALNVIERWTDFLEHIRSHKNSGGLPALIVDQSLLTCHPVIATSCASLGIELHTLICTEETKNFETFKTLYFSLSKNVDSLFVIGGGICCDIGAFVGAFCGTRVNLIPTTLLSLVDAGIGGKTGVNHPLAGKNQVGLFANIESVTCIKEFLFSMPDECRLDGISEISKHAWLSGDFAVWRTPIETLLQHNSTSAFTNKETFSLIKENVDFKQKVVMADPTEKDIRMMLNLGHTVAHLLEGLNLRGDQPVAEHPSLSHGVSVALGLESLLRAGLLQSPPEGFVDTLLSVRRQSKLQTPLFDVTGRESDAVKLLLQDKKNDAQANQSSNPTVRCILPSYGALATLPEATRVQQFLSESTRNMPCREFLNLLKNVGLFK